jgi:hypothetical protein
MPFQIIKMEHINLVTEKYLLRIITPFCNQSTKQNLLFKHFREVQDTVIYLQFLLMESSLTFFHAKVGYFIADISFKKKFYFRVP